MCIEQSRCLVKYNYEGNIYGKYIEESSEFRGNKFNHKD